MKTYNLLLAGLLLVASSCSNEENTSLSDKKSDGESHAAMMEASENGAFQKNPRRELGIPDGKYLLTKETHLITWEASKITGSTHSGIILAESGKFMVEEGVISRGVVSIKMNSFEVTDITGEDKANFEGHLTSEDFLSIETFPTARLMMNGSSTDDAGTMTLDCAFDFHGVVVNYNVPFTAKEKKLAEGGMGYQINGAFTIDRTKHNMTYGSGSVFDDLGDRVINDGIKIGFEFTAI